LAHRAEGLLRHVDARVRFHALFAFFLLLEELALAADVAAVARRSDVLAHRAHRLATDDLRAERRLDRHLVLLPRDQLLELRSERTTARERRRAMDDDAQRVERLAVDE